MSKSTKIISISLWSMVSMLCLVHFITPLEFNIHWVHIIVITCCVVAVPFYKWKIASTKVDNSKWMKNTVITLTICVLCVGIYRKHLMHSNDWELTKVHYVHKTYFFKRIVSQSKLGKTEKTYRTIIKTSIIPYAVSWNQEVELISISKQVWEKP